MAFARGRAVSLWLVPERAPARALRARIRRWARALGTPAFAPHVTLLGGMLEERALEAVAALARRVPAFDVATGRPETRAEYFRCVALPVAAPPGARRDGLACARALALSGVGRGARRFEPHLSLVYADLSGPRREAVAAAVADLAGRRVRLGHVEAVRVAGPPDEWRRLARRRLLPATRTTGVT